MTENMKKFGDMAAINEALRKLLSGKPIEEVIAIGAQNGVALTDADFKSLSELGENELAGVTGGCDSCFLEALRISDREGVLFDVDAFMKIYEARHGEKLHRVQ